MLKEGSDFYYNDHGDMVFTKEFLERRGFCCQSGCTHCPYDLMEEIDPSIPLEFQLAQDEEGREEESEEDLEEEYT